MDLNLVILVVTIVISAVVAKEVADLAIAKVKAAVAPKV